jgi:hypothetical protein
MVYLFGRGVEIVAHDSECWRGGDHARLRREARVARIALNFDVDESCALCLRCGKAVPLK